MKNKKIFLFLFFLTIFSLRNHKNMMELLFQQFCLSVETAHGTLIFHGRSASSVWSNSEMRIIDCILFLVDVRSITIVCVNGRYSNKKCIFWWLSLTQRKSELQLNVFSLCYAVRTSYWIKSSLSSMLSPKCFLSSAMAD